MQVNSKVKNIKFSISPNLRELASTQQVIYQCKDKYVCLNFSCF